MEENGLENDGPAFCCCKYESAGRVGNEVIDTLP